MQSFFWCTFGIFFVIASIVGFLTIISFLCDLIWKRKKLKKQRREKNNSSNNELA